jgi:hypothetical protein
MLATAGRRPERPVPTGSGGNFHWISARNPLAKVDTYTSASPDTTGDASALARSFTHSRELPEWLVRPVSDSAVTVAQAILSYRNIRAVPASTEGLLDTLSAEIGTTPLADINYDWTEQWISVLKREKHLAPGTIRKKKGALSRIAVYVHFGYLRVSYT